jgi:hypothetical protein
MEFMTHHDAGHISLDNLDHVPLTNYMSQQTILECDSIIYEAKYTEDSHHGDEGKYADNPQAYWFECSSSLQVSLQRCTRSANSDVLA